MTEFGDMIRDAVGASNQVKRQIGGQPWPPWALSSLAPATLC
jgi:hypothetical protein